MSEKKGLFVCYDPHALMQFLQFYCMGDFKADWDALCLPVENGEEYMHSFCEETGIFHEVYAGNVEYQRLPLLQKLKLFLRMFLYATVGKRKKCCEHILNEYVGDIDRYDILASNIDTGFISGMLASFAKEKDVVYFEDGSADYYIKRSRWKNAVFPFWSLTNIQCVLMAWLGYFAKGYVYFEPTRHCYKYVTNKAALAYSNYKEIREFSLGDGAMSSYLSYLRKIYPGLDSVKIDEGASIFFTDPLDDWLDDYQYYNKKITDAISRYTQNVIIKRHPRDKDKYVFPPSVKVSELDNKIPGEVYFPLMQKCTCYFASVSSVIIGMKPFVSDIVVFHIKDFETIKMKARDLSRQEKFEFLTKFMDDKFKIVDI